MQVKVKIWIEDDEQNLIFGSGKTEVLEYIDRTGSIADAAKEVGMNYKKAWNHIKILEKFVEDDLVITFKGRGENSGTSLTPKAREVIQTYKILQHDIKKYSEDRFKELFQKNGQEILSPKENK
ncbi:winged helix-turn-helix domain-containing protein [Malaciobacter mytili]|uniref:Molybdenum transporter n=1 Tax=Malaciobacter mytili LMG 24559 TaxID=1032238 RepID=A0AAX2AJW0_9BACT|nr:winged helix-turn-helix domain-containing protein [Malaciobacter mytili]AXH14711.1 transcriptional regulator, ModE family [Malaciobacter mytili LMG 24559]RXI48313.1 molybdenum transporter [Malaciobacter mytili]RXK16915.1 molybdenum transporter [Malaciobacter mytili LMG 24559]